MPASTTARPRPSREQRDHLLNVVYGDDPRPPDCPQHEHARVHAATCTDCHAVDSWRMRMSKRFRRRGLALWFDKDAGPKPPPCPDGHSDCHAAAVRLGCRPCRRLDNWRMRSWRHKRAAVAELAGAAADVAVDTDAVRHHVKLLREAGLSLSAIARAAQCSLSTVKRVLGDTGDYTMRADIAQRILAVLIHGQGPALMQDSAWVAATGTRRRVQAACRNGHTIAYIAHLLGYAPDDVWQWLRSATVHGDVAEAVTRLYPALISRPGKDQVTAELAALKQWAPAHYYSGDNIDDPSYRPYAIITDPVGVYRRLRAMAWDGNGPRQVAPFIGESITTVTAWLRGKPAPAYAARLLDAALENLPFPGPDDALAARARRAKWPSPLAWHDIDIDDPRAKAYPDVRSDFFPTQHPLQSQVLGALYGIVPARDLVRAEKIQVVRALHMLGWSDRRIAAWLRWSADSDNGLEAVGHFRLRWGITGGGLAIEDWGGCRNDDDFIVTPAAA